MNTHDDHTNWRELTDALTPQQFAYLENWESHPEMMPPMADGHERTLEQHARTLLSCAREFVGQNAAAALYADVSAPPEDGHHYAWEHYGDGSWFRFFTGTKREVGKTVVEISGLQDADGAITRSISVYGETEDLDADQARLIAGTLLDAASELERLH